MTETTVHETEIIPNARLELLRMLAHWRDYLPTAVASGNLDADQTHIPLFGGGEWQNDADAMCLAVRECAALGEIEATIPSHEVARAIYGAMLAITDRGYDAIRAHDALGEAAQERAS